MTAPSAVVDELAAYLRRGSGAVGDPRVGWPALLDLAAAHRLLPALWAALTARGVRPLPEPMRAGRSPLAVLARAYEDNAARTRSSRAQLVRVLDARDAADADPVPIKGGHWLLAGWIHDPAARVMVDLDVLVSPARAGDAVRALEAYRYEALAFDPVEGGDHQLAPMVAPGRPGAVELHVAPVIGFHRRLLTADELRARADVLTVDSVERAVPHATDALIVLLGHAQLQEEAAMLLHLPLRALHDVTNLRPEVLARVDWDAVAGHFRQARASVALAGFSVAAAELMAVALPVTTRGGAAWYRAARWAVDHPAAAHRYREAVLLPRALRPARMQRLYGVDAGLPLARARLHHVTRGAATRLRRG